MKTHYLLPAVAASLLSGCVPSSPATTTDIPTYPVLTVTPADSRRTLEYPATIQGFRNVEVRPRIEGYIAGMYVDEGAVVRKGQLLFRLHAPTYEQEAIRAEAAVKSAEAAVGTARIQLRKTEPLVARGIISEFEGETARQALAAKEADLDQARAALRNARVNLGYARITSPSDGVIGRLPYKTGSLVGSAGEPLTVVSDISTVYAWFSFTEKQFLELTTDASRLPPVRLVLADGKEYSETGRVETTGGQVDTGTGTMSLRAAFRNPAGRVRSGSTATVRIVYSVKDVLAVPAGATFELQGKKFVFSVDSSGVVHARSISVEELPAGDTFLVSSGLTAGERIVSGGLGNLRDGDKIQPKTTR